MLLPLLACTGTSAPPEPADSPAPAPPVDTGAPLEDAGTVPPEPDDGCADLYDPTELQAFEIEISEAEWAALEADYASGAKIYHPIVFRYGDEAVEDAMIRLKGNPYFSWFSDKMQFVVA